MRVLKFESSNSIHLEKQNKRMPHSRTAGGGYEPICWIPTAVTQHQQEEEQAKCNRDYISANR